MGNLIAPAAVNISKQLLAHFRRKQNEVVFNDPTNIKEILKEEWEDFST